MKRRSEEGGEEVEHPVFAFGAAGEDLDGGVAREAEAEAVGDGPGEGDGGEGEEGGDGDLGVRATRFCRWLVGMSAPTRMSAGEVAKAGMTPMNGATKRASRKSRPVTMAVTPVRPPAATPAADSM